MGSFWSKTYLPRTTTTLTPPVFQRILLQIIGYYVWNCRSVPETPGHYHMEILPRTFEPIFWRSTIYCIFTVLKVQSVTFFPGLPSHSTRTISTVWSIRSPQVFFRHAGSSNRHSLHYHSLVTVTTLSVSTNTKYLVLVTILYKNPLTRLTIVTSLS